MYIYINKKKIHLLSTNSFNETFCQTNKVQVKKDKIAKYSAIEPNLSIQNKFNLSHSHQILTMTIKDSPWALEK